jgi:hypothetical protein
VLSGDLRFWLVVIGYDPRSKSINNHIYLVYALAFFTIWVFMILTWLADAAARFLQTLPFGSAVSAAAGLGAWGLLAVFLYELYRATRRSPFIFSEADAHHLCTAPLARGPVALVWLLTAWIQRGLPIYAVSVVIAYALVQALAPKPLTTGDLPFYLVAGFRMVLVIIPLYLGLLSVAWSAGAWRLRSARERINLRWLAPGIVILFAGLYLALGAERSLVILTPLAFFVRAGLGLAPWLSGLGLALVVGVLGMALLWFAAREMSLARAAQETRDLEALRAARLTGRLDLAGELADQSRLRVGAAPSRIPAGPRALALVWKNAVQMVRRANATDGLVWLATAGLAFGALALPGWGAQGWAVLLWMLLVIQTSIQPLRKELSRWWIFRQLPIESSRRSAAVLALPVVKTWLAGLAAFAAAVWTGHTVPGIVIWLYLICTPAVALTAGVDILRQSKSQDLLAGRVPEQTLLTVLLAALVVALNGGAAWMMLVRWAYPLSMAVPFIVAVGVVLVYGLWKDAGSRLREMQ